MKSEHEIALRYSVSGLASHLMPFSRVSESAWQAEEVNAFLVDKHCHEESTVRRFH